MIKSQCNLYTPSQNTFVNFDELTNKVVYQLSKIYSTDNQLYPVNFIRALTQYFGVKNMSIHDVVCVCVGLYLNCIGANLDLNVTCKKCNKKRKITIDLVKIYNELLDFKFDPINISINDYDITISLPTLEKEVVFLQEINDVLLFNETVPQLQLISLNIDRFIQEIKHGGRAYKFESNKQKINFYQDLDLEILEPIMTNIKNLSTRVAEKVSIFNLDCIDECDAKLSKNLTYDLENYTEFISLLLCENPQNVLQDLFYLTQISVPFDISFNITPTEKQMLWNFYIELINKRKEASEPKNKSSMFGPPPL